MESSMNVSSSEDSVESGQDVTRLIMNLIQLFVGVPGNCLILRVYWTKTIKTSTHVVIMALAWADLAVCLMAVTDTVRLGLKLTGSEIGLPVKYVFSVINEFRKMTNGFSVLITIIIAADRYDCVCRANRRFSSYKRAKTTVWIAFINVVIVGTPVMIASIIDYTDEIRFLTSVIQLFFITVALLTILICYGNIYRTISNHVKMTFASGPDAGRLRPREKDTSQMPTVVSDANQLHVSATGKEASSGNKENCTVDHHVTSLTSVELLSTDEYQATGRSGQLASQVEMEERRDTTANNDQRTDVPKQEQVVSRGRPQKIAHTPDLQRKTTRMLFITSVIFLLTWLPFCVNDIVFFAEYGGVMVSPVTKTTFNEIHLVFLINNAVNPFIYSIANRRFRKDCREVLRSMKLC